MKKLIMLAAVLGLAHTAQAESEISTKAEYRVRAALSQGADLTSDDSENAVKHRFKLSTEYKASDAISAQLTLVHNASWGASDAVFNNGTVVSDRSNTNPNNASNNTLTEDTSLVVNEAYANWRVNDEFTIKLGRGSFEGGAGTSTAVNDFQDVMTAFDGVAGIYETDFARVIGYVIKFADFQFADNRSPNYDAEANTVGLSADLKFAPEIFEFFNVGINQVRRDQYTIENALPSPPFPSTDITRAKESYLKYNIGFKANFAEMFSFRAAYSGNTGERTTNDGLVDGDISSSMMDLEAGIHMEDMMNFKFSIGYHQDSGDSDPTDQDDEAYSSYYYDVHRYAGLMDVVQWGNLTYLSAKASIEPMENFTIGIDYHMFTATESEGETKLFGNGNINSHVTGFGTGLPTGVQTTEDEIGNEIDIYATHTYENGLELTARYGLFMAGDRLDDHAKLNGNPAGAEDYQTFFVQGTFSF